VFAVHSSLCRASIPFAMQPFIAVCLVPLPCAFVLLHVKELQANLKKILCRRQRAAGAEAIRC
jgi:hypothetical protein